MYRMCSILKKSDWLFFGSPHQVLLRPKLVAVCSIRANKILKTPERQVER